MIRETKEWADPELVAIGALVFLAEDPERLERFLLLTGNATGAPKARLS